MKDPASVGAATGGALLSAGAAPLFGLPVDAMLFGLMGGVAAVLVLPPKQAAGLSGVPLYLTLAGTIVVAVLAAAALGPFTAAVLHMERVVVADLELRAYSFLWGFGAQAGLLIAAFRALRRRIQQLGGVQERTTQ